MLVATIEKVEAPLLLLSARLPIVPDQVAKRAYVELRDADDDGGEVLVSAIFSFRMKAVLSKRQIEIDLMRKARHIFKRVSHGLNGL
jgi:hypothetical protein